MTEGRLEFQAVERSYNLLQKAKAVSDLIDVVVSILPWVNLDSLLPALKHPKTIQPYEQLCKHSQ